LSTDDGGNRQLNDSGDGPSGVLVAAAASGRIIRTNAATAAVRAAVHRQSDGDERRELRAARLSGRLTASRACALLIYFRLNMVAAGLGLAAQ